MARHTTFRGAGIDMDSLRRENEKAPALGNMGVNARGDRIVRGIITKTADELARENHRIPSAILKTGLKGAVPESPILVPDPVKSKSIAPITSSTKKKEIELPNGDIIQE
jgi:hypothetical protein